MKLIFILLFFAPWLLYSQTVNTKMSNDVGDCTGAVVQSDSTTAYIEIPKKHGNYQDLALSENPQKVYEHNSIWLVLEPKTSGKLVFTLYPENKEENFQFYLFKGNYKFCEKIFNERVKPVAEKSGKAPGDCGLKEMEVDEDAAVNLDKQNFFPAVEVEAYDVYYLVIDHHSGKEKFKFAWEVIGEENGGNEENEDIPEHYVQNFSTDRGNLFLLKVKDAENKHPVDASVIINGNRMGENIYIGNAFKFDINKPGEVIVQVSSKGYFFKEVKFSLRRDNKPEDQELVVFMDRLEVGRQLSLPEIKFVAGADEFLQSSYPILKRLLDFMVTNNDIVVQIQGHVNGPDMENTRELQKLSEKRAKAVYKFLKDNGVDKDRMETVGLGNTMMKYEEPRLEEEAAMNRRVEIKIIDIRDE